MPVINPTSAPRQPIVASAPTVVAVGSSDSPILPANPNRKGLTLIMLTTGTISLAFDGNTAVLEEGITLFSRGASFNMSDYTFTVGEVRGIGNNANQRISVQEFV